MTAKGDVGSKSRRVMARTLSARRAVAVGAVGLKVLAEQIIMVKAVAGGRYGVNTFGKKWFGNRSEDILLWRMLVIQQRMRDVAPYVWEGRKQACERATGVRKELGLR